MYQKNDVVAIKNDIISIFSSAVDPAPKGETDWMSVLKNIQSDKYRAIIEAGRLITDPAQYREFKKKLPAVTFSGNFTKNRNKENLLTTTGFLIPDIDHLENVEEVFSLLSQDENIWFLFRSPSGSGLKGAVRAEGIRTDDDIKILFAAAERYFKETYDITIDPACKNIARLTFISWDPHLFINENPFYFNIRKWQEKPVEVNRYFTPADTATDWKSKYGKKVLDGCCQKIATSARGEQHHTRLTMGRTVGGFIASGFIDEAAALAALEQAVRDSGAKLFNQAMKTVQDAIANGKNAPIHVEPRQPGKKDIQYNFDDIDDIDDKGDKRRQLTTVDDTLTTVDDTLTTVDDTLTTVDDTLTTVDDTKPGDKTALNLHAVIREWIKNSSGSFTSEQLDRDLVLTTREEKKQRSKILSRCIEKKLVKKDMRGAGKFHIINSTLDEINLDDIDEKSFDLILPFSIHRYTSIPKKSIIVLAGSSNAGKTALILNTLKNNLPQNYKRLYLMSEMGRAEYADRLRKFKDIPFSEWKKIVAAERTCDFDGAIENHNPDGLTCIDFLEEVEGDYFKIATDIRHIYNSLGDGVAIIAIQKKSDSDYARGGQATAEKARLYLAVDLITSLDHSIICALKIIKNKRFINRNLQGHEIHFRIHRGAQIEAVSPWLRSTDIDRNKFKSKYEQEKAPKPGMKEFII